MAVARQHPRAAERDRARRHRLRRTDAGGARRDVPAQGRLPAAAGRRDVPVRYADGEREIILRALRDANGVIGGPDGAAARLGLRRTTLQSKMRKLGIVRPSF